MARRRKKTHPDDLTVRELIEEAITSVNRMPHGRRKHLMAALLLQVMIDNPQRRTRGHEHACPVCNAEP